MKEETILFCLKQSVLKAAKLEERKNTMVFKVVLLGKLKGAQCSETVKSRVPSI